MLSTLHSASMHGVATLSRWLISQHERVHDTTLVVLAWRGCWMSGAARFQTGQSLSPADESDVQVQQGITDRGLTD